MTESRRHNITIALFFSFVLSACTVLENSKFPLKSERSNCNHQNAYTYARQELPKPLHELDLDTVLTAGLSFNSLNVAHAIGILEPLAAYINKQKDFKAHPAIETRLDLIELSQAINQQINFASLEVSAVASEIDCEEERANQLAAYLKDKEDNAETRLTVGAIIAGAAGAITTGILLKSGNESNAPELIGIGTGLTEATLGLLILLNKPKKEFYHPRNALKEIWEGKATSDIFPASVWYYLNYANPEEPDKLSLRQETIARWMSFEQMAEVKGKKRKQQLDIYLGSGGRYSAEQLKNRGDMYDQLESVIKLMKQDLKSLAFEIENLK